jgi:hypothetical protein
MTRKTFIKVKDEALATRIDKTDIERVYIETLAEINENAAHYKDKYTLHSIKIFDANGNFILDALKEEEPTNQKIIDVEFKESNK